MGLLSVHSYRPVKLCDLHGLVASKHKDSNLQFAREYEVGNYYTVELQKLELAKLEYPLKLEA